MFSNKKLDGYYKCIIDTTGPLTVKFRGYRLTSYIGEEGSLFFLYWKKMSKLTHVLMDMKKNWEQVNPNQQWGSRQICVQCAKDNIL